MWADLFRRWRRSEAGNVAMIFALALPVLVVMGGAALDLQRASVARSAAQDAADAAVLAAAASRSQDLGHMRGMVRDYLVENLDDRYLAGPPATEVDQPREAHLRVRLEGSAPTMFLGLIGVAEMPVVVTATAARGAAEEIELALVLDNTWSMSDRDARGTRKIDALKAAARLLVEELMQDGGGKVRVGVVPYGDYVNVGVANRGQPWVSVPADRTTSSPRTCRTITSERRCTRGAPRTCTRTVDGVRESYDCTPSTCTSHPVTPYERCTGGGVTRERWYGCVASRTEGVMRLNDTHPEKPYPGLLATRQNCLTPITPLTDRRNTVLSAIDGLIVNVGGYRPSTYIPAGVIWGVNVLSPTAPFTDGEAYDDDNRQPRKIMVLMTDGENTLRFDPSDGRHVAPSGSGNSGAQQLRATNDDTAAICDYARSKQIEIYTVALAVSSSTARNLLEDCATDADHYFDARDTAALRDSFAAIAASINRVRLVE